MINPLISIVIPTYNDFTNLKDNIEKIINQSFNDFEIIIINDCSTDETEKYLSSFNNTKVNFFSLEKNKGPGYARNIGIKKAKGKWISFLDSDDRWNDNRLREISKFLINNNQYDLICHNELQINKLNGKKKKLFYGPLKRNNPYKDLLLNGNRFSTSATILKKKFLLDNNILFNEDRKFFSVEDYDFWLKCMIFNANFKYIKSFLGYYYVHNQNITNNILKHKKNYLRVLYHHTFQIQKFENKKLTLWKELYIKYNCEIAIIYLKYFKNLKKFTFLLIKCMQKKPIVTFKYIFKKFFIIK